MALPITISIDRAVALTGLGRTTIYRMLDRGEIESSKVGRRRLLRTASLMKAIGAAEHG